MNAVESVLLPSFIENKSLNSWIASLIKAVCKGGVQIDAIKARVWLRARRGNPSVSDSVLSCGLPR